MEPEGGGDDIGKNRNVKIILIMFLIFIVLFTIVGALLLPTPEKEYEPEWMEVDFEMQEFVAENLTEKPVFIYYHATLTAASEDEMDPFIISLMNMYESDISFIEIVMDDIEPTDNEYISYFDFDIKGDGESITDFPMFTIITRANASDVANSTYFTTLYGSSPDGGLTQKAALNLWITEAIGIYNGTLPEPDA